jgi:hypothetical protein
MGMADPDEPTSDAQGEKDDAVAAGGDDPASDVLDALRIDSHELPSRAQFRLLTKRGDPIRAPTYVEYGRSGAAPAGSPVSASWLPLPASGPTATAVVMKPTAAPAGDPKAFVADRPFAFVLRCVRTGLVLFTGRVADPRSGVDQAGTDR